MSAQWGYIGWVLGRFFILRSSDIDDKGPFLTIGDVFDLEYFWAEGVPGGELSYDTAVVPADTIRSIGLAMCGEDGGTVIINGVHYIRQTTRCANRPRQSSCAL